MNANLAYSVLALATGLGIPVMAALNAGLAARIGSPPAAGIVLFGVGGITAAFVFAAGFATGQVGVMTPPEPSALYFGGVLVAFYVLSITWLVPRFGVGSAVFFVLLG